MPEIHLNTCAEALLGGAFLETIADAELRPSPLGGQGLFNLRPRAAGESLGALDGQVVDPTRHPHVMHELEWNALSPTALLVRPLRTSYGYINHSPTPNVVITPDGLTLRTARPLAPGEEFTLDYFAQPVPPAYLATPEARHLRATTAPARPMSPSCS